MPEPAQEPWSGRTARRSFQVVEVTGPSMVPTLYHGDWLLVQRGASVRPGDVVILRHPFQQDLLVVKRAAERRDGGWWVLGDNAYAGGDSTDYGTVPEELVLARVRARYRPLRKDQRSVFGLLGWAVSAVRRVSTARSVSRRLRAR
ncbi:nickel-type superoxide dismutase maturation protease [Streptomyces atroolivaceus]|uniref:nickel-type superoxide dismutase maturation protease n=1 Tax=Streptomyces atroolivaceus TaxID=66869 RepID=UPI00378FA525